ncbi:hypothetical protein EJ06DRAFT_532799 [Trichodelitschia bisporula]|uniref:Uncharacterized protein n=1 Tax=Trichodelitschia bisporula TaxID=703511 RepID=A0A6G1HPX6_9PEZI|nr:hypothetical protein EJ06DRAFT_532799 [Trichodelitschia bisporula]
MSFFDPRMLEELQAHVRHVAGVADDLKRENDRLRQNQARLQDQVGQLQKYVENLDQVVQAHDSKIHK